MYVYIYVVYIYILYIYILYIYYIYIWTAIINWDGRVDPLYVKSK